MKRAAVIGVGYLGNFHAQKYKSLSQVELVGVFDANSEQGQKIAGQLGIKCFATLNEIIGQVDMVTIASSTSAHYELAKFFLSNKIHVNVEKPITVNSHQGQELVKIAKANNLKFAVGHIERFNPAIVELKKHIRKPVFVEMNRMAPYKLRGADVSVVHDLMIHDIDLILSMDSSPVVKVSARGDKVLSKTYDVASCTLEFQSGLLVQINSSRIASALTRTVRVLEGEKQYFANLSTGELEVTYRGEGELTHENTPLKVQKIETTKVDALKVETELFVNAIQNNTVCAVTGDDGLRALEVVERIVNDIGNHHSR